MFELNPVKEDAKYISEHSEHVKILESGVEKSCEILLDEFRKNRFDIKQWKENNYLHPNDCDEPSLNWIFIVDTLNFCFWSDREESIYKVKYESKDYTGYWSLCAAINRAVDEKIPITDPSYLKKLTINHIRYIFRYDENEKLEDLNELVNYKKKNENEIEIPLIELRLKVLNQLGEVIVSEFKGKFSNVIDRCEKSSLKLLGLVTRNIESYDDSCVYKGKKVCIFKRAQILIADIWACFEGKGYGEFHDIDETLTMFADYRVPQVLLYLGVLQYDDELLKTLGKKTILPSGSELEVEIRGSSIHSVEKIKELLLKKLQVEENENGKKIINVNSITIDFVLWDYAKLHSNKMKEYPIHRTYSWYY